MFQGEAAVDLEVLADALYYLEVDVVERRAAGNKALGGFLTAPASLHPFVSAQVIGDPELPPRTTCRDRALTYQTALSDLTR